MFESATTQRNAMRLVDEAHPDNGHLATTWDGLGQLFGNVSPGSVRRHLAAIQKAGIIHYSTHGDRVYINLLGHENSADRALDLQKTRVGSTKNARGIYNGADPEDPERALDLQKTRVGSTKNARGIDNFDDDTIRNTRDARALWKEGWMNTLNQLVKINPTIQNPEERSRTLSMLTSNEIGVSLNDANLIARAYPADAILKHCLAFLLDRRAGSVTKAGALLYRIAHPEEFAPQPITDAARGLLFYKQHATEEDATTDRRYLPDEYADLIVR